MKVTLTSTTQTTTLNGVPARIWEGTTGSGIPVHAYITRIAVLATEDNTEFERELQECAPPRVDLGAIPLRLVL